ncbi:MAG: ABC transporter substrate-binding protein [Halanaerobiales bacterium]|nr:ABC transporter substrate-binding protein [Halanaerobiales bacterium]
MFKKKLTIILLVSFLLSFVSPLTLAAENEKTLVLAYDKGPETMDHIKTGWYSDALVWIFDRLVSRDYNFQYKPGLAKRWDVSADGLIWTFYLRENVKFHNGEPLTARDVKWTFDTILDPKTASPFAGDMDVIKEVVIRDQHTVDIELKYTFPNLLFNLSATAAGIAWHGSYQEYGSDYGSKYVIGTGPYMLKEWRKGDRIILDKNPDYTWGPEWMVNQGPALIDQVILRTIPEENVLIMELETGGVHISKTVPTTFVERLEQNAEVNVIKGEATKLGYLAYACDQEPFTDIRVRQAINHAIDRKPITLFVLRDLAKPAYGYLPPALKDEYLETSAEIGYKYNPERARELLAAAGLENGFETTLSADNSSRSRRLAEVIQAQLLEVGIKTKIQLYDSSGYVAMLKEGKQELFIRQYSWPNADILDWFLLSSQMPYPNHSRWVDLKTDQLINAAATAPNWEERAEGYKKAQQYLIEQAVWCPIYVPENVIAVRKEVKDFKYHPWMFFPSEFDLGK